MVCRLTAGENRIRTFGPAKMVRRFEATPVDLFWPHLSAKRPTHFLRGIDVSNPAPSASGPNFTKHWLRAEPPKPSYAINGGRWGDHCLDVSHARLPVIVTVSATRPWEAAMWPVCQHADRIRPARGPRAKPRGEWLWKPSAIEAQNTRCRGPWSGGPDSSEGVPANNAARCDPVAHAKDNMIKILCDNLGASGAARHNYATRRSGTHPCRRRTRSLPGRPVPARRSGWTR